MSFKEVSVVVSTYTNERLHYVLDCIESLKTQTLSPKEIILALDPNETLLEFYKSHIPNDVKIVVSEGYGLSYARNAGVKNAKGEIIAFIDDDAVADRNWLKNLIKNCDDPCVVGVGGLIKPVWQSNRPIWFPSELDWIVGCTYKGLPRRKTCIRNPIGCNMSFRKNVFKKVGYFNTNIGRFGKKSVAGEEPEFSIRVLEKLPKSRVVYEPSAVVYHKVPRRRLDLKYIMKRSFYEGYSKALISNSKSNPSNALSTEEQYLRYLLEVAIPSRLKRIHKFESICHLTTLLIVMYLVMIGYLVGLSNYKHLEKEFP